jgi:holo-[acyl-carrier protein] synthase
MTLLIGIDFQSIDEVEASIVAFGSRYVERIYTSHEIESCSDAIHSSAIGLADRFAAKEAVMKVLDMSDAISPWREIEIHVNSSGRSTVALSGVAAENAERQGLGTLSVSLSHTDRLATAIVVAEFAERDRE